MKSVALSRCQNEQLIASIHSLIYDPVIYGRVADISIFTGNNRVKGTGFWRTTGTVLFIHFLQPALFALAAIVWIFPIELFLRTMAFPDGTSELRQALTIIALSIVLIIFTLMPGVVFLRIIVTGTRFISCIGTFHMTIASLMTVFRW